MLRKYIKIKKLKKGKVKRRIYRVIWWRKRRNNRGFRKFRKIYLKFGSKAKKLVGRESNYAKCCFFFSLPHRQHQFTIWKLTPTLHINFSTGKFLNMLKKHIKFYKRDSRNAATVMLQLKKVYGSLLKYVYLMKINNYNYRQYNFFVKYMELFKPFIYFFQHKQSFIPRWNPKRRIKRRVLRLISSM